MIWHSMDTAPKDRKIILMFCGLIACGSWENDNWTVPSYGVVRPTCWREV